MTYELNGREETLWKLFLDKDLQTRLHKDQLGYPEYSILEHNESGPQTVRKASAKPKMELPGPIIKLLGSDHRYIEDGQFDKSTKTWRARLTHSSLADKIRQEYTMRSEPVGTNKVRILVDYEFEARIFGVGGLMESSFEKQLRQDWDERARFLNQELGGK